MGTWGVKSYELDEAADALDAAFDRVHGDEYERLMDDRNPLTFDQVHHKLASVETLAAAIESLRDEFGDDPDSWDETARLAFAGVVVRHAEFDVAVPDEARSRAVDWLEREDIDWDSESTARRLRRDKEIALLRRS